ncbi:MAG TPA: ABC transporter permease subunit [Burkholderiaceae bacterium]|nr:ABC transporter permease subunit [Burkholderiaceae bacterium]
MARLRFSNVLRTAPALSRGDGVILLALAGLLYIGARLALDAPAAIRGPAISLAPSALPWYAALSVARMAAAYALSLAFSLAYGYYAAYHRRAERVMVPLLDVLQSVPILSFLPVVLLSLAVLLPASVAAEVAAIVLIFTSQVWNMTFSFYQSVKTVPGELREAAGVYRFGTWFRLRHVELPFAAVGLVWNSMMSWAGGWFFLMAAEMFTVGDRDFRLPGLGSYLQTAAGTGDLRAVLLGVGTLVAVIVALDQLLWRPLLAWAGRFSLETVEGEREATSWFRELLVHARLVRWLRMRAWTPLLRRLDRRWQDPHATIVVGQSEPPSWTWRARLLAAVGGAAVLYFAAHAVLMLATLSWADWVAIGLGLGATLLRVMAALVIAAAWTIPVGIAIGTRPRLAAVLQPLAQIAASVPATALFPIVLLVLLRLPRGLDMSAVLLMLLGAQWYLLFNVIAGSSAIPQDLRDTAALLRLSPAERWRTLLLPALFPFAITGAITAAGGAWNASIVAEYVQFAGDTHTTVGIGALIAQATIQGHFALLLAATLAMVIAVALINRLLWQPLYRLAQARYRME